MIPSEEQNNQESPMFDDALPASLKQKGAPKQDSCKLKLRKNQSGVLSPYIIKIGNHEHTTQAVTEEKLKELANQLITNPDLFEEDAPSDTDLEVGLDELSQQLQDFELQISKAGKIKAPESTFESPAQPLARISHDRIERNDLIAADTDPQPTVIAEETLPPQQKTTYKQEATAVFAQIGSGFSFFARIPLWKSPAMRAVSAFVLLAMVFLLPMQAAQGFARLQNSEGEITDAGRQAIDNLMHGAAALETQDFDIASSDFERAAGQFQAAQDTLGGLSSIISTLGGLIPKSGDTITTANALIIAGQEISTVAADLSAGAQEITSQDSINLVTKLEILETYIEQALPHMAKATEAVENIEVSAIPAEYAQQGAMLKSTIPALYASMTEFTTFSDALTTVLGQERKMRYLVAFQNNTELRATGGFIGSFAEIDVLNGEIVHIHVPEGGTYDLQGQLTEFVEAPQPLQLINPRWEFHDSNWLPDFALSAQKMLWFYENAGGPTVDGVIAINASMIPDILAVTGPVDMPGYDRTIDSENFLFETQKIVEYEYEKYETDEEREEEAPKQFIGDLADTLLMRLQEAQMQEMLELSRIVANALTEKELQLYFKNDSLQAEMEMLGWSGTQTNTSGDYLMVVNTNLGGGKTDSVISQDIDVEVSIDEYGTITNTVTITKTHHGLSSSLFEGVNNVDYVRVYVPKGSKLTAADGFEIPDAHLFEESEVPLTPDQDLTMISKNYQSDPISGTDIWEENGKTVFGNWMQTAPGEEEQITFTYKLPFSFDIQADPANLITQIKSKLGIKDLANYTLFVQKQSGVEDRITSISIHWPEDTKALWQSHDGNNENSISISNEKDQFLRFLLENNY